ncbi:hypothetical protein Rctr85_103 [Virus Rctr85]|nr:hypothetical protein Rctr85_103 [Virus Rctr85]
MEAWGGEVKDSTGADRQISLYDAVQNDPSLPTHPQLPVIEQLARQTYFVFDRERCAYPGGHTEIWQTGAIQEISIGCRSPSVLDNIHQAAWFYPSPGRLKEIHILCFTNTLGTINDPITWWLHEAGTYPTPGNVLLTGVFGLWVADKHFVYRLPEEQQITLEPGTEYVLRVGYNTPADSYPVSTYRSLQGSAVNNQLAARFSRRQDIPEAWAATTQPMFCGIVTEAIGQPIGGTVVETNREIAPERTESNATLVDTKAAGAHLYAWCQAYLADHDGDRTSYDLDILGDMVLPRLGDTIYVRGQAQGTVIDPFTDDSQTYTMTVEANLRVDDIGISFENDVMKVSLKLSEGNGISNTDELVALYDTTKSVEPPQGSVIRGIFQPTHVIVPVAVGTGDPDATMSDGRAARQVTLAYPTAPSISQNTPVLAGIPFGTSPRGDVDVEMVSWPDPTTATGAVIKVCVAQSWIFDDTADLDAIYYWY